MWPLILADLALSGIGFGINWYQQQNNQYLNQRNIDVQKNLYNGYVNYLRSQGREINPDRAWGRYLSGIASGQNSIENSQLGLGASALGLAKHSMFEVGRLYRSF